ncbi:MAG: UDP-N-acetylmuramoyl-tripeptide--D-alanyl-D-alanine ligase [Candidatus Omnitrophota bacterium]
MNVPSFTQDELIKITRGRLLKEGRSSFFKGVTIDSRCVKKGSIFLAIKGVNQDGHDFIDEAVKKGAAAIIVSKEIRGLENICIILVNDTTRALGALGATHRLKFNYPVIAITGSAGKTTTKELIFSVLSIKYRVLKNKGSFNNHWGVPLTLLSMDDSYSAAVLELGTNNPGEIRYLTGLVRPEIVVLTNIGPCHLKGLKTVRDVYREKRSILDGLKSSGGVVFNNDDRFLRHLKRLKKFRNRSFGFKAGAEFIADEIEMSRNGTLSFRVNKHHKMKLRSPVRENISNALAAVVCGRLFNISFDDIRKGLFRYPFNQHRQEIERFSGLTVINDSYNANPISFRSAISTLISFPCKGRKVLVCGDMLELGRESVNLHGQLAEAVPLGEVDIIFSYGPLMKHFVRKVNKLYPGVRTGSFQDMEQLKKVLVKTVSRRDVILVKGSRGMKMERCLDCLKEKFQRS